MPACKYCGAKVTRADSKSGQWNATDPITNNVVQAICAKCYSARKGGRAK
jgi:hypothetical protein